MEAQSVHLQRHVAMQRYSYLKATTCTMLGDAWAWWLLHQHSSLLHHAAPISCLSLLVSSVHDLTPTASPQCIT